MVGSLIYDPSYGGTPFDSEIAWENHSLEGLKCIYDLNPNNPTAFHTAPALHVTGIPQTTWSLSE